MPVRGGSFIRDTPLLSSISSAARAAGRSRIYAATSSLPSSTIDLLSAEFETHGPADYTSERD
jgi:hypothetical protein